MAAPTTSPGACGVREAAALLAESETSGSLAEPLRNRLAGAMSRTSFGTGETLLRQGEVSDSLFVVAAGRFEVRLRRDGGIEDAIGTIGPGGAVGEMQLVVGGVASATLVAVEEAQVLRLRRQLFDVLCDESPELLETVARVAGRRVRRHRMLDVLPSLLGPLDGGVLGAIEEQATWLTLRSGEVLFHKGDPGDAWYVVTSGRMAVVEPSGGDQADRLLAEVGPGEALGELSLLTGEPRSATVYALRDTELVRFPMDRFAELVSAWPQVANAILRTLARRLVARGDAPRRATGAGLTLALVPATPGVDVAAFAERLAVALSRFGPTLHASSARLGEIGIARETAGFSGSHPAWIRVGAWLEAQAASHRFLLLVADAAPNAWSALVVGHADQVILVADADGDPSPGALEVALRPPAPARRQPRRLLALLHRDGSKPPQETARWLDARTVDAHVHVRLDREDDIRRVARGIAGRGVALALSGGGARCFAHLGVVLAMRELGIPIDLVTGTSAGALSGYLVAADSSDDEMRRSARIFHEARPFSAYTLPLFSLIRGERLSRALADQCGRTRIEDLWLPFVAVSSNLTRRAVELHTRGPAWAALRASCSLPGIVEPWIRDGELLVDGGLIDNLPVGVARERLAGRVIAVDVSSAQQLTFAGGAYPSPWTQPLARFDRRRDRPSPPGVFDVLLHSMLLASLSHVERMRLEADVCLRPELAGFGMLATGLHARIIDAGYRHAIEHLRSFDPSL